MILEQYYVEYARSKVKKKKGIFTLCKRQQWTTFNLDKYIYIYIYIEKIFLGEDKIENFSLCILPIFSKICILFYWIKP